MTAPMCAEHQCPVAECEGVQLTRSRRVPMCMCGHPKAVHEQWRVGLDCGLCDCLHYETARRRRRMHVTVWGAVIVGCAAFWVAVWFGIGEPILDAIRRR